MSNYKNLDVWKLSIEIVKEIYILAKSYPSEERYGLFSQTNRAVVSIPSNLAEGFGRNSIKDTIHFLYISRGSAYEVETLLNIAFAIKIINEESYNKVNDILERVLKVINGYINYLEKKL
jgi:four helix bundle protein